MALRVFAWNLDGKLTAFGKKQIALNVIERGRAWHWTRLPRGWFDLKFCLEHGQRKTKQTLRELFPEERLKKRHLRMNTALTKTGGPRMQAVREPLKGRGRGAKHQPQHVPNSRTVRDYSKARSLLKLLRLVEDDTAALRQSAMRRCR